MAITFDPLGQTTYTQSAIDNITLTTGGTAGFGLIGGLGTAIGFGQQAAQFQFLNYSPPEPQKQAPKHSRFIDELRSEIREWHGELRAA